MEIHEHCKNCVSTSCAAIPSGDCEVLECSNRCGLLFHKCKQINHNDSCMKLLVPCLNKQFGCPKMLTRDSLTMHLSNCPASTVYLNESLMVDFNLGSITERNRCIRRSEYHEHCKLGSTINESMIEQPCPMAHAGCTFTFTSMQIQEPRGKLVKSELVPTYSVQPDTDSPRSDKKSDEVCKSKTNSEKCDKDSPILHITDLPVEVLVKILQHLDGFSLFNLALTCKSLRDACKTQLVQKGMVSLKWKPNDQDGPKWINEKKWSFSISTTPVYKWKYNGAHPLMHHLTTCTYYHRSRNQHEGPQMKIQ